MASRARKIAPRGRSLSMTAESVGMRMKSYYDSGHLCRISYPPSTTDSPPPWLRFVELPTSSPSPLFSGGDTGVSTARVIRALRGAPCPSTPRHDGQLDGQSGIALQGGSL